MSAMSRRLPLYLALLLTITVGLTFWHVRNHGFSKYDDQWHVVDNGYILPPTPANLWFFWRLPFDPRPVPGVRVASDIAMQPYRQIYSPLSFTVWGLLAYVAGKAPGTEPIENANQTLQLDASVYHSFSLLLHIANVLLVFLFFRRLIRNDWAAFFGAAVFGLHPFQVEPVSWITGMNNLLSVFFSLLALLAYDAAIRREKWSWGLYSASTLCFLAAVLAKPSATPLPLIVFLMAWAVGRWQPRRILEMVPWFLIAGFSVLTTQMLQTHQVQDPLIYAPRWYQRPLLEGDALAFYITKTVFPWFLGPDYGRRPDIVLNSWWGHVTWLLPAAMLLLVWWLWKRELPSKASSRLIVAAAGIFLIALIPTSGIVPYYFHAFSTVSDHYMYLALVGVGLALATCVSAYLGQGTVSAESASKRNIMLPIMGLVLLFLGGRSMAQVYLWRDDKYIWGHVLNVNPKSSIAYLMMGYGAAKDGDRKEALKLYRQGLSYAPDYLNLLMAASIVSRQLGYREEAMDYYRRILRLAPESIQANYHMGEEMEKAKRYSEALKYYEAALQYSDIPYPEVLQGLGTVYGKMGDPVSAEKYLRQALDAGAAPAPVQLYLGIALAQQGRLTEAVDAWILSLGSDPNQTEAYLNIGLAYLKLGDMAKAENSLRHAIRLDDKSAVAHYNLGLVLQQQKRLAESRRELERAVQLDAGNPAYKKALEKLPH